MKIDEINKRIIELEKGCGKEFKPFQSKLSVINYDKAKCGDWKDNTFFRCDECGIELDALKLGKEAVEETIKIMADGMIGK